MLVVVKLGLVDVVLLEDIDELELLELDVLELLDVDEDLLLLDDDELELLELDVLDVELLVDVEVDGGGGIGLPTSKKRTEVLRSVEVVENKAISCCAWFEKSQLGHFPRKRLALYADCNATI